MASENGLPGIRVSMTHFSVSESIWHLDMDNFADKS